MIWASNASFGRRVLEARALKYVTIGVERRGKIQIVGIGEPIGARALTLGQVFNYHFNLQCGDRLIKVFASWSCQFGG